VFRQSRESFTSDASSCSSGYDLFAVAITQTDAEQRDQVAMAEPERLCDYQAIFLVEVFSKYRARRCSRTLSPRFETMYLKVG
jgi:hypothetical protein